VSPRGLAPWVRERLPLLWVDGALAAVANHWVAAPFATDPGSPGLQLRWTPAAALCAGAFGKRD